MYTKLSLNGAESNSLLAHFKVERVDAVRRKSRKSPAGRVRRTLPANTVSLRLNEAARLANPLLVEEKGGAAMPRNAAATVNESAWDLLESMMGTVAGPPDWSSELDHYLYGTPRRNEHTR